MSERLGKNPGDVSAGKTTRGIPGGLPPERAPAELHSLASHYFARSLSHRDWVHLVSLHERAELRCGRGLVLRTNCSHLSKALGRCDRMPTRHPYSLRARNGFEKRRLAKLLTLTKSHPPQAEILASATQDPQDPQGPQRTPEPIPEGAGQIGPRHWPGIAWRCRLGP